MQNVLKSKSDIVRRSSHSTNRCPAASEDRVSRADRAEQLLGLAKSNKWWAPIQELLNSLGVVEVLESVRLPDDRPHVTMLRRLDIALWR